MCEFLFSKSNQNYFLSRVYDWRPGEKRFCRESPSIVFHSSFFIYEMWKKMKEGKKESLVSHITHENQVLSHKHRREYHLDHTGKMISLN